MRYDRLAIGVIFLGSALPGCSLGGVVGNDPLQPACVPGELRPCDCPNGGAGLQPCSLGGVGYGVCVCDADGQAGDADSPGDSGLTGDNQPGSDPSPTEPDPPAVSFSFVVFGDNQFATEGCTSGIPEREAVPRVVRDLQPTFAMHTGDLMDHGYDSGSYERFETCEEPMLSAIPFFPTTGNHDHGSGGILKYRTYLERQLFTRNAAVYGANYTTDFVIAYKDDPTQYSTDFNSPTHRDDVPSGVSFKTFYAFRYANSYFLSFEQGTRYWTNTPKSWVRKHLSAARADPSIEHIFVTMHHPMYSTTMSDNNSGECVAPVRNEYEALFREFNVTMVFAGHAHLYDHLYVPDDGSNTVSWSSATYPNDGRAIHYVVTGGAGGALNPCSPISATEIGQSNNFYQKRVCNYHVTRVEVTGHKVGVRIVTVDGSASNYTTAVFDEFALE